MVLMCTKYINYVAENILLPMLPEKNTVVLSFADHFKVDTINKDGLKYEEVFHDKTENRYGSYSKWNQTTYSSKKSLNTSSLRERPKIGNKDTSKEAILKKVTNTEYLYNIL